ncbi:MAG TPA: T9SS type A sorting domain-containing protein, partial [Chitinophagales bacterium]|nr:T9SS type A sorting domain-containing protein [Chitinophagales bacterium]
AIGGATTNVYVATTSGNYKCRVTKTATGCIKMSNAIAVLVTCKEGENIAANNWTIYPNPAHDNLMLQTIDMSQSNKEFMIVDVTGKTVQTITATANETVIDLSTLPNGLYLIQSVGDSTAISKAFVKQ